MNIEKRVEGLEKRVELIEKERKQVTKTKKVTTKREYSDDDEIQEDSKLVQDFHAIIDTTRDNYKKGVIISGGFIHLKTGENKVKTPAWSSICEMNTQEQYEKYLYRHDANQISELCSQISSKEKLEIIRKLILKGPLSQSEILSETGISQGQFYHYIKDLISFKLVEREKQDQYSVTQRGHLFTLSFLNATNTFIEISSKN